MLTHVSKRGPGHGHYSFIVDNYDGTVSILMIFLSHLANYVQKFSFKFSRVFYFYSWTNTSCHDGPAIGQAFYGKNDHEIITAHCKWYASHSTLCSLISIASQTNWLHHLDRKMKGPIRSESIKLSCATNAKIANQSPHNRCQNS